MMVKRSNLFGFANDLEKLIYGLGYEIKLKSNNNDRALFRVNAGADAVASGGNTENRDISGCVPSFDPSYDNRIIVQNGLNKQNKIDFSYYERKKFF